LVQSKDLYEADKCNPVGAMIGDVNLFLNDQDDSSVAEIEVMIAEQRYRRQGCARDSLLLMMHYGISQLAITRFYAKINETNEGSMELFRSLGFREVNYVKAFQEYEFELNTKTDAGAVQQVIDCGCRAIYGEFENTITTSDVTNDPTI
jgi:RimJ/RimL family protein N-acetyltransferase